MKEIVFEVLIGAVILGLLLMAIALFRDSMGFIRVASETVVDTGKIKSSSLVDIEANDAEVKGSDVRATLKYIFEGHMTNVEIDIEGNVYNENSVNKDDILNGASSIYKGFDFLDRTYKQTREVDGKGRVTKYIYTIE